jgi:hypothetical protein
MSIILDGNNATTGGVINAGTAQNSTSGTAITFTGIPSTAKRITVMFQTIGTNGAGSSPLQVQIGSGSVTNTGYLSYAGLITGTSVTASTNSTTGFVFTTSEGASSRVNGIMTIANITSTTWVASHSTGGLDGSGNTVLRYGGGSSPSLSGALDRVVVTTVNGTDTFTAGSINIFWE